MGSASDARLQSWWRGEPTNQRRPQGASVPGFVSRPTSKTREKRPGDKDAHQYFSESNDKENEIRKHIREKRIRETGLFYILPSRNHGRGNSPNSIRFLCILFTPGCQTFRDERHYISPNIQSKISPLCPSYESKIIGTLSRSLRRPLLRRCMVDAESWGEYVTVACQISILSWFSNKTETSVDDGARKSNNWLDQWQSGKLSTGSLV